jgi:hypothetical protein
MQRMKSIPVKRITPEKLIVYIYIRAKRKNVAIKISDWGEISVFAPLRLSLTEADKIVDSKHQWISRQIERVASYKHIPVFTPDQKTMASKKIRLRVDSFLEHYSGIKPNKVFIRYSSSRWGSCSSLGNISLNGYLFSLPDEYFEYVLIHELTHLYHLNHSYAFWKMLSARMENWKRLRKELSQYKLPSRHTPNH